MIQRHHFGSYRRWPSLVLAVIAAAILDPAVAYDENDWFMSRACFDIIDARTCVGYRLGCSCMWCNVRGNRSKIELCGPIASPSDLRLAEIVERCTWNRTSCTRWVRLLTCKNMVAAIGSTVILLPFVCIMVGMMVGIIRTSGRDLFFYFKASYRMVKWVCTAPFVKRHDPWFPPPAIVRVICIPPEHRDGDVEQPAGKVAVITPAETFNTVFNALISALFATVMIMACIATVTILPDSICPWATGVVRSASL